MSDMDPVVKKLPVTPEVANLLNKVLRLDGFFPEFSPEHVEKVFLRSGLYLYPKGAAIIKQDSHGRDLYVLYQGKLAVSRKEGETERHIANLKEGDIFGEIGLLRNGVRVATVSAETNSKVFHLAYADIEYLLKHNHALGEHLILLAKERLGPENQSDR